MEYLLRRYKVLSKKERKGFTLVELLVVIAILAVLASVSVVGYLGFTNKAKNSNAVTELTQVREVIRASLIDGETDYYKVEVNSTTSGSTTTYTLSSVTEVTKTVYESTDTVTKFTNGFTIQYSASSSDKTLTFSTKGTYSVSWSSMLKKVFPDLSSLNGTLYVTYTSDTSNSISTVIYHTKDGGKATWKVSDDSLVSGEGETNANVVSASAA